MGENLSEAIGITDAEILALIVWPETVPYHFGDARMLTPADCVDLVSASAHEWRFRTPPVVSVARCTVILKSDPGACLGPLRTDELCSSFSNQHIIAPQINGANGEATMADDLDKSPRMQQINNGLKQLQCVSVDSNPPRKPRKTQEDRDRDQRAAHNRIYQQHLDFRRAEEDDQTRRLPGQIRPHCQLPLVPIVVAPPTLVVDEPIVYDRASDVSHKRLYVTVSPSKLSYTSMHRARLLAKCFIFASCLVALYTCFVAENLCVLTLMRAIFIVLVLTIAPYVLLCLYWFPTSVCTKDWDDGGGIRIYPLVTLYNARDSNPDEVNAMAYEKFNAYRNAEVSGSVLKWLTIEKMGKPTSFSQQQYASVALKKFGDHVDEEIIINTASYHHQRLLARHYMFKLQCGNVNDTIERL